MALAEYGNAFNIDTDGSGNPILVDPQSGDTIAIYDRGTSSWQVTTIEATTGDFDSVNTDRGVIRYPTVAPNAQAQGEAQVQTPISANGKTQLLAPADTSWTSEDIAWGSIFPAYKFFDNPLGDYYLYYAEDHASPSSVGVAFADDPIGPYTDYGSNPVIDTYTVNETPSPVWNAANSRMVMFTHSNQGTKQSTMGHTSSDGLSFTDEGIVIDTPENTPGDGHTGYFSPNRWGGAMWGYHLLGGTNNPRFGVSYPDDETLLSWTTDPRPIGNQVDTTGDRSRRIEWNMSNIVSVGGSPWWIGPTSTFVSGTDYTGKRIAAAPLANKRRLGRRPTEIVTSGSESWEGGGIVYPRTFLDHRDRRLYATYTSGGAIGAVDLGRCF